MMSYKIFALTCVGVDAVRVNADDTVSTNTVDSTGNEIHIYLIRHGQSEQNKQGEWGPENRNIFGIVKTNLGNSVDLQDAVLKKNL